MLLQVYDLGNTGYIEREEVKTMMVELIAANEGFDLPEEAVERIIEQVYVAWENSE